MPFVGAAGSGEVQRARWSASMADRVKSVANSSVSGCGWRREWQRSYPFRTDDRGCRDAPKRSRLRRRSFCSPACATSASTSAPTVPARDRSGRRASSSIIGRRISPAFSRRGGFQLRGSSHDMLPSGQFRLFSSISLSIKHVASGFRQEIPGGIVKTCLRCHGAQHDITLSTRHFDQDRLRKR